MVVNTDLLIVGAGPAGLAYGFWRTLADEQLDYLIVDADSQPGGWIRTHDDGGFLCEAGPQGIRPNDASDEFIAALGIGDAVIPADPAARLRYIARNGRLHPLPAGPGGLFSTRIFTLPGKLRLFCEPFKGRGSDAGESLADFAGRRFGRQTVPLAEAMASGVYGGDAHAIEMASAFPAVARIEQEHGSLIRGMFKRRKSGKPRPPKRPALCSFDGGMQRFVGELRDRAGEHLRLDSEVAGIARSGDRWKVELGDAAGTEIHARELVLAIPARRAAALLAPLDQQLADELGGIPYASIANIYLGFNRSDVGENMNGFGFLLDRREQSEMLGAIFCSAMFRQSAPADKFLVRIMAGGMLYPEAVDWTDDRLASEAEKVLRRYTGIAGPVVFQRVSRARDAIPQYVRGHGARRQRIRERLADHPGLQLIGNSYDEVSVVGQLKRPEAVEPAAAPTS